MFKRGVIDCLKGFKSRSKNPYYLVGFGRQYEREECNNG
jgi:hypothetical protein